MKKWILITGAIVFVGNITGQRTSEDLVSIIKFEGSFLNKEVQVYPSAKCCMCSCYYSPLESPEIKKMINEMYMTRIENIHVITGGLPDDIDRVKEAEMPVSSNSSDVKEYIVIDKICQLNPISTITITPEDIRKVPSTMSNVDILAALQIIGCPGSNEAELSLSTNGDFGDSNGGVIERDSQGPFTGLEGHNFIEDPAIIYPNPVREVLNVKSTDPITVIEILGITGQVELELDPRSTMDVSTLAAGTYYARIHFENIKEVQVEKMLVVK
jgi:hypothetical protein